MGANYQNSSKDGIDSGVGVSPLPHYFVGVKDMGIRWSKWNIRARYIDGLERKIELLEADNDLLQRDNASLKKALESYKRFEDQMKALEEEYRQSIRDARHIIDECKEVIADGKATHSKYTKQMRWLMKTIQE